MKRKHVGTTKKFCFARMLISFLALGLVLSSCAGLNAWLREGGGLVINGLEDFNGAFVTVLGKSGGETYLGTTAKLDGVQIKNGQARLTVYGPENTIFEGDATVDFDVLITERADQKSKSLGLGRATADLRAGSAIAQAINIQDMRPKSAAAPTAPSTQPTPAPTPAPTPTTAPATASAGSFDYRTIADNGVITAVTTAANARSKGQVFISGTTLTAAGGEQKALSTTKDAALIAIAAEDKSDIGRGTVTGWSKVQSLKVDGTNVIQEIIVVPATSAASQLTVGVLNNFLKSAKKVSIPGEKNGAHLLTPTQAQNPTITIPAGTTLNLLAPTSGNSSVIKFGGWLTLVVEGTVTGENNNAKLGLSPGTGEVILKKGSKSGVGQKGDWTASAFMGMVNGL